MKTLRERLRIAAGFEAEDVDASYTKALDALVAVVEERQNNALSAAAGAVEVFLKTSGCTAAERLKLQTAAEIIRALAQGGDA